MINFRLLLHRAWIAAVCAFLASLSSAAYAADDTAPTTNAVSAAGASRLVILKAVYGDLPNGASADVTLQVVAMVKSNTLVVAASNDNFEDAASGVTKQLRVDYTIDGIPGSKSIYENGTLKISLRDKPAPAPAAGSPGLVIRKAVYGDLPDGPSADVTALVAPMVENDALELTANNENLGDTAPGVGKKLRVDYTLNGKDASQTVKEDETLKIPGAGQ